MKKIIALALALVATTAYANVVNSPHDVSAGGNGVCRYCHTPHHGNPSVSQAPIWARNLGTTITPYAKYGANLTTTSMSLLCMSCHDGTTAIGTFWNQTGVTYNTSRAIDTGNSTGSNLGTDLRNDHPVGVVYDSTTPGVGLVANATATGRGFVLFTTTGATGGTYMECGTCHDPHVYSSVTTAANYKFKRSITVTDFCAACHELK